LSDGSASAAAAGSATTNIMYFMIPPGCWGVVCTTIGGYPDPTAASVEHGPVPAVDRLGRRVEVPHGRHSLAAAPPGDGCSNSPTFVASDRAAATTGTVVNITGGSVID
jgi:hypothetical protein